MASRNYMLWCHGADVLWCRFLKLKPFSSVLKLYLGKNPVRRIFFVTQGYCFYFCSTSVS